MNRHRIEVAIAHLRSIPADVAQRHVDMRSSGWTNWAESAESILRSCSTTACPGGWLCFVPEFRKAGLRIANGWPIFGRRHGFSAIAGFFGIPFDTAREIFCAEAWPEHGQAALDAVCAKLEALL